MKTPLLLATAAAFAIAAGATAADVKTNWATHCLACHGPDGRGQTKAGRIAGVKDMTDTKYHETRTDEKMAVAIKDGFKEGDKEKMKAFKEKLNDEEIKALVAFVRGLKK